MLTPGEEKILSALLQDTRATPPGPTEARFRANHPNEQRAIEHLLATSRIQRNQKFLTIRLLGIDEISTKDPVASNTAKVVRKVFSVVREHVIEHADSPIRVGELASSLNMFASNLQVALGFLIDSGIFATYSNDLLGEGATVTPSVQATLNYEDYDALIAQLRSWAADQDSTLLPSISGVSRARVSKQPTQEYVSRERILELRELRKCQWDLARLLKLCEELNAACESESWMACAMLVRAITDHVPPVFNCRNFSEVSNNVAPKSFSKSMKHLDVSLRNVADSHLHTQIRQSESLPTFIQVNFCADLDVLLAEIARRLKPAGTSASGLD
jgi:hypothetical protein